MFCRENEEESNNQEDAIQNHTVSRRRYFKTYINIPETQKTHDTAILEADLDLMTTTQVTILAILVILLLIVS